MSGGIRGDPEDGLGEGVEELFPRAWVSLSPACATHNPSDRRDG